MNINSIIHEQIDWDRTIKSFELMEKDEAGDLWVAFPGDYVGQRNGPFYFLDKKYDTMFSEKSANCRHLGLPENKLHDDNGTFTFKANWHRNIRTNRDSLTYYALYLPEFAIPTFVEFTNPLNRNRPYAKTVFRDDDKKRFVLYLDCPAVSGKFSFNLKVVFHEQREGFEIASYQDNDTVEFYQNLNHWEMFLSEPDRQEINTFFVETNQISNYSGDIYNIQNAAAVGPHSSVSNDTFNQQIYILSENMDYNELAGQLVTLRNYLSANASGLAHQQAINAVENAREAADEKDGSKVIRALSAIGKWALNAATDIGTDIVAEVIKKSMGIST